MQICENNSVNKADTKDLPMRVLYTLFTKLRIYLWVHQKNQTAITIKSGTDAIGKYEHFKQYHNQENQQEKC